MEGSFEERGVHLTPSPRPRHGLDAVARAPHVIITPQGSDAVLSGYRVWCGRPGVVKLAQSLEGALMSELVNVLPVLGAIIVLGAIVLGSAARPQPQPVRVKRPKLNQR
jgi:hypothetical protein